MWLNSSGHQSRSSEFVRPLAFGVRRLSFVFCVSEWQATEGGVVVSSTGGEEGLRRVG